MARTDASDVKWAANVADPESAVRTQTERVGGNWKVLLATTRCGYISVWSASNGSQTEYFVADGHTTAREANEDARDRARAFTGDRRGWRYGIMRTGIRNENRYRPNPSWLERFVQEAIGFAPCTRQGGAAIGTRG